MKPQLLPRKSPRQARSKALVTAILDATAQVLVERGYAGSSTNLIASRAGVSIGSVYQYFPNKDSLIAALRERHATDLYDTLDAVLTRRNPQSLEEKLSAIVHGWMLAHQLEPDLHRVVEQEFPFFERAHQDQIPIYRTIVERVRQLLEEHREQLLPDNLDLATWMVLQTIESLIHAATTTTPLPVHQPAAIEQQIVEMLTRYLQVVNPR
ncbi:TetR/AcrR family transcriptional regulator [Paenalcaligenes suwonensis]|uniref:TetR/AcrR family transcriptional regulator n=1 Tax=Paenalcaligenes suwonensis TaxID=1202713 RepID=UPI001407A335|nr:TetR/AcrR family transcriptional regulator [Paenalcaligenes suwonensis]NHC62358.1 TetR/AcrR family transcriptional regulator [Paenalcaligenes suwonensis]